MTTANTDLLLRDLSKMRKALSQISKARTTWRKYQKTAKERNFTLEQVNSAKQVLRESVSGSLALLIECGMGISQMDEQLIETNAESHAEEIIA